MSITRLVPSTPSDSSTASLPACKTYHVGTLIYTSGGLVVLFCWLLWGDFAWSLRERSVGAVVLLMLRGLKTSDMLVAILTSTLPHAIGMVLGPIIGYRSDRHRGSLGRRIPYLLVTAPIATFSIAAIGFCPVLGRALDSVLGPYSPGVHACVLIVFAILWTTFEFAALAGNAVFGALINDVVPRELLGRFFGIFRVFSLLAGILFSATMIGKVEAHFSWAFIGLGAVYGVGFTLMCLNVKEGKYPPPPPDDESHGHGFLAAVRNYFKECFANPYYLWLFIFYTLAQGSFSPVNIYHIFFAKSLDMPMTSYGNYVAVTYTISIVLSYSLGSLADRFHPLRVGMASLLVYAMVAFLAGLFINSKEVFAVALISHGVISGVFLTSTASLGQRLFPKARFAQFNSALEVFKSIFTMILIPIVGTFLDLNGHCYRYTYLISSGLAVTALLASGVVYKKFLALGGPDNYVAPE